MCDLLEELNIPLPEQQTSIDDPLIIKALEANPDIRLGFDACLNCAKNVSKSSKTCRKCGRVSYCSSKCRDEDSNKGHGAVVCSLLKLCNEDEAEEELDEKLGSSSTNSCTRIEASQYRVQSERESFPATLANIIIDGPVYQKVLRACANKANSLTIHLVGASDSELWEYGPPNVYEAYSEALAEIAEMHKISRINLVFVGPECRSVVREVGIKFDCSSEGNEGGGSCRILFEGLKGNYEELFKSRSKRSAADIVVLFNPGFTCQDYSWKFALRCIKTGTPILITTNTEMEAIMDAQYLLDQRFIKNLPKMIAEMIRAEDDENDNGDGGDITDYVARNDDGGMFFGENPYAGGRVRQSGTMGNDLYIKSKWMLGGLFCKISSNEAAAVGIGKKRDVRDSVGVSPTGTAAASQENILKKQKGSKPKNGNYALI